MNCGRSIQTEQNSGQQSANSSQLSASKGEGRLTGELDPDFRRDGRDDGFPMPPNDGKRAVKLKT